MTPECESTLAQYLELKGQKRAERKLAELVAELAKEDHEYANKTKTWIADPPGVDEDADILAELAGTVASLATNVTILADVVASLAQRVDEMDK